MHQLDDPIAFGNFIQRPPELCQELEQRITAEFQSDRTLMRDPVSPGVKLVVTLRHLATGDSYTTLQYAFRVASAPIKKFVPEVCDAIIKAYRDQVVQCPHSQRIGCWSSPSSARGGTFHMPWVPWMEGIFQ